MSETTTAKAIGTGMHIGKYMSAHAVGTVPESWIVRGSNGGTIGLVEHYPPWRQYVFSPEPDAVLSAGCMRDMAAFLESWNRAKAAARAATGAREGGQP